MSDKEKQDNEWAYKIRSSSAVLFCTLLVLQVAPLIR